jgi:hypothetical protein
MFGWLKKQKQKDIAVDKDFSKTVEALQAEVARLKFLLEEKESVGECNAGKVSVIMKSGQEKVVEGVFNGFAMDGGDGKQYDVPANYASKSKLVEGDLLKLTISNTGSFVFKQIQPVDRERRMGVLEQDPRDKQYYVGQNGHRWKLITASVTYFKGQPGDEVIFLVPTGKSSQWAAVENILNK